MLLRARLCGFPHYIERAPINAACQPIFECTNQCVFGFLIPAYEIAHLVAGVGIAAGLNLIFDLHTHRVWKRDVHPYKLMLAKIGKVCQFECLGDNFILLYAIIIPSNLSPASPSRGKVGLMGAIPS